MRLKFEPTTREHAEVIASDLRREDYLELMYSSGNPRVSTVLSAVSSDYAWTGMDSEGPVCIFGVMEQTPDIGVPWMLGVTRFTQYRKDILVRGREYVGLMKKLYPYLHNFVHQDNVESIRWLEAMGFSLGRVFPQYGVGRQPFIHFYLDSHV